MVAGCAWKALQRPCKLCAVHCMFLVSSTLLGRQVAQGRQGPECAPCEGLQLLLQQQHHGQLPAP